MKERILTDKETANKEMAKKAQERPTNYNKLSAREQWEIDKKLGILDWNGEK
jgi:hypothetical protein